MTYKIVKCNRCDGNGDVSVSCPPWGYWYEKCPTCEGSGMTVTVNDKRRPYLGKLRYRAASGRFAVLPQEAQP